MPAASQPHPTFRFAPSPTGRLHLGHALSAVLNAQAAEQARGRLLLRIENTDLTRCTPENETAILDDLRWLGLKWEQPVRRQSNHFGDYAAALERLRKMGLLYPAFLSRTEMRGLIAQVESEGSIWPRDPDGVPLYPDLERNMREDERTTRIARGDPFAWRLDMRKAVDLVGSSLSWIEQGSGPKGETGMVAADPAAWGDVVLARKDTPASYMLAVVVDDALQGVTTVLRGQDLFHATSVQRLLQSLLGYPAPVYHHHRLILDENGRKLSKSSGSQSLSALREAGATPDDIRRMVGL